MSMAILKVLQRLGVTAYFFVVFVTYSHATEHLYQSKSYKHSEATHTVDPEQTQKAVLVASPVVYLLVSVPLVVAV